MRRLVIALLAICGPALLALPGSFAAAASGETRTVHFRGETVEVPASWPVIRLAEHPRLCVRMDRRAVYLGTPGSEQSCPSGAMGRSRAILVDPGAGDRARASRAAAGAARTSVSGVSDYVGLGFDACATPSRSTMTAWRKSPYRAIGIYIGGGNRACAQPNLTSGWVSSQTAAGWHLIPTYVGLQAPTSSCSSCAKLSPASASLQGTAAANDAVADARAVGIEEGSPIYFDMEGYTRTASATSATLKFLAAWTNRLHALGYDSGVYSSSASGIADLVTRIGTPYPLPDDIWMANWNGRRSTSDPYVPDSAWTDNQRIHQYRGGHNETWGGVTINIDNNYVEGATAGSSDGAPGPDDPKGSFDEVSSPAPGQIQVSGWAFDPNAPAKTVSIVAYVGGEQDGRGGNRHDLGEIADRERSDVAELYPRAGAAHGFEQSFAVVGSGRQRVCLYAVDIGRGNDRQLGCRMVGVPVPISLTPLKGSRNAARVHVRCEWPAGTQCPGRIMLRAKVRVRAGARSSRRARPRLRLVQRGIANRGFRLTGERGHTFRVPLTRSGRRLTRDRSKLWAKLVVAIPGGRAVKAVRLR